MSPAKAWLQSATLSLRSFAATFRLPSVLPRRLRYLCNVQVTERLQATEMGPVRRGQRSGQITWWSRQFVNLYEDGAALLGGV